MKLIRQHSTRLYTLGELLINGQQAVQTVESTLHLLPTGVYDVELQGGSQRRRIIAILAPAMPDRVHVPNTLSHLEAGGSWKSAQKNGSICIGTPLMAGALKLGTEPFERLFDRIEKAEKRQERTHLIVEDAPEATYGEPIRYWLEPANHGCQPTQRHVEKDASGNLRIYEGPHLVRLYPAEPEAQEVPA